MHLDMARVGRQRGVMDAPKGAHVGTDDFQGIEFLALDGADETLRCSLERVTAVEAKG